MKTRFCFACSLPALLLSITAHAQVTIDITKITCQDFSTSRILPVTSMALWFSGYYNGKRGATVIDASAVQRNAEKVEAYCRVSPGETVMNAVEKVFGIK